MPGLFRPPLPKRSVQLSSHCAFQRLTAHPVGDGLAVSALGITPTSLPAHRRRLVPFALWPAFPTAPVGRDAHDYYGTSVALGLAPGRPSRLPSAIDVRARRRCPVRPLERGRSSPPTRRRVRASAVSARYPGGPASDALRGMCASIAGDWGSRSLPFTIARGPREPRPYAPSGRSRFPTMLLSPSAFASR